MTDTEQSGAPHGPKLAPLADLDVPDPQFNAMTARLLRREALRRAAEELNTASPLGLEDALARISAEVTAEAVYRQATVIGKTASGATDATSQAKPPERK